MTKLVLFVAAVASLAVPAMAASPISFQRDGVSYVGTVAEHDGVQHIVGREVASGRIFDLTVRHGRVSGSYDGYQVLYLAPDQSRQLASR